MEVVTRNQKQLLAKVDELLNQLHLDEDAIQVLKDGTFQVGSSLDCATVAAAALDKVFRAHRELSPAIQSMLAVK